MSKNKTEKSFSPKGCAMNDKSDKIDNLLDIYYEKIDTIFPQVRIAGIIYGIIRGRALYEEIR